MGGVCWDCGVGTDVALAFVPFPVLLALLPRELGIFDVKVTLCLYQALEASGPPNGVPSGFLELQASTAALLSFAHPAGSWLDLPDGKSRGEVLSCRVHGLQEDFGGSLLLAEVHLKANRDCERTS